MRYLIRKSVLHERRLAEQRAYIEGQRGDYWTQGAGAYAFPVARSLARLHERRDAPSPTSPR